MGFLNRLYTGASLTCGGDGQPDQREPAGKTWLWWAREWNGSPSHGYTRSLSHWGGGGIQVV